MADLQNGAVPDYGRVIARLRGVVSARVVRDDRGDIIEIHAVADGTRSPKAIARDIETVLLSEFNTPIDYRKISIAEVSEVAAAPETRLKFLSIDYSLDRASARARVSVGCREDTYIGAASTLGGEVNQPELVARATLEAVQEFLRAGSATNGDLRMELRDFSRGESNGTAFFAVTVRVHGQRGELDLIGSAIIRDDPWKAAACATLDALNRRLSSLGSAGAQKPN
jgi:hypothetical protein